LGKLACAFTNHYRPLPLTLREWQQLASLERKLHFPVANTLHLKNRSSATLHDRWLNDNLGSNRKRSETRSQWSSFLRLAGEPLASDFGLLPAVLSTLAGESATYTDISLT